jgi:hypothetical protein
MRHSSFRLTQISHRKKVEGDNRVPHHEDVLGSEGTAPLFVTLALNGDERSASRPWSFYTRRKSPRTHWFGGLVGSRENLEAVIREVFPLQGIEPRPSST